MVPLLFLLVFSPASFGGYGNNFVYTQLKYKGAWDPYPGIHQRIFETVTKMTNIPMAPKRKVVELMDPKIFETPFLLIKGNSQIKLSKNEKKRLKQYINRGGFVLIDDTLAQPGGSFGVSVRRLMGELFPDRPFQKLPIDHALFRSFFLLRNVAGRRIAHKYLEGLDVGGGIAAEKAGPLLYSAPMTSWDPG